MTAARLLVKTARIRVVRPRPPPGAPYESWVTGKECRVPSVWSLSAQRTQIVYLAGWHGSVFYNPDTTECLRSAPFLHADGLAFPKCKLSCPGFVEMNVEVTLSFGGMTNQSVRACVCRVWAFGRQPMWARADACVKTFLCSTHNSTAFCPAKDSRSIIKARNGTRHWKLVEQADISTFHKILTLQTWRSSKSKYTTAVVSTKWAAQLVIHVVHSSLKIIFG